MRIRCFEVAVLGTDVLQSTVPVPVQIPEYNESVLILNAWRLPEGTACMVTAGSRNRYYPQPHLAQGSARESAPPESAWLLVLGTDSVMGTLRKSGRSLSRAGRIGRSNQQNAE